jgi:hypothetical protein
VRQFAAVLALTVTSSCGFELTPPAAPPPPPPSPNALPPRGPNELFRGCFTGPVVEPANTPPITVIFGAGEAPPGTQLIGCGILQGDPNSASTFMGTLREDALATADVTFMRVDGNSVPVVASHDGNDNTPAHVSLEGVGVTFRAENLARCPSPPGACDPAFTPGCSLTTTCRDLGIVTP